MKKFFNDLKVNGVEWSEYSLRGKMLIVSTVLGVLSLFVLALAGIFKLVTSDILFLRLYGGLGTVLFVWFVKATIKIEYKK